MERFWSRVDIKSEDDCWEWLGNKSKNGYGKICMNGKVVKSHRYAWFLANGEIPDISGKGQQYTLICHKCDNPSCVNPNHLFTGTNLDNMNDMARKGRAAKLKGESHGRAKLTETDVRKIRSDYSSGGVSQSSLGSQYGVTKTAIRYILSGKNWGHII